MEHNAAARFFGRGGYSSMLGTILNVPPEKRSVFFAASVAPHCGHDGAWPYPNIWGRTLPVDGARPRNLTAYASSGIGREVIRFHLPP